MINNFNPLELNSDILLKSPESNEVLLSRDAPKYRDVLSDGRETVVIGDVEGCKEYNHLQGDNPFGFRGTCGLVSCEDVLKQFGIEATEAKVVEYALTNGLCHVSIFPSESGGTTPWDQARILTDFGVPSHIEFMSSLERLADLVEEGRGIITEVNAGVIWDDPNSFGTGEPNHAIVITGVARDPSSGEIQGFFINDSGRGFSEDSGRFIDIKTMQIAWSRAGGAVGSMSVITDITRAYA